MQTIRVLYPGFNNGQGIPYVCHAISEAMQADGVAVETWYPASNSARRAPFAREACPRILVPLAYRLPDATRRLTRNVERSFLKALRPGDIAYLFPGVSIQTQHEIKGRGNVLLSERINCHTGFAKRLLDREYDRIDWAVSHGLTEQDVASEDIEMELADFIFAPSPLVARSFEGAGVPTEKILLTSYGWSPARMNGTTQSVPKADGLTVIFSGRLCIRKGVHLLLEAWEKANIKGRLIFAGALHHDVKERLSARLTRPDIVQLGHTSDIGAAYRSADLFAFPSLEEGSPLVTYEAMGSGLPVLVSPMAVGPARDGVDGMVLDPHDIDGWVSALRKMADDSDLRKRMGHAARERAQQFTWKKVGARRRELLFSAMKQESREAVAV